jgi:cation:H+ antiporter
VTAMWLPLLGILAGLALLTYASDQFVVGAARLAARLRLSTVVIGAVVIGFGTSAPEMVVSGLAAAQGSLDIAVGNIVGSNIANLSLVLGTSALVVPIAVRSPTIRREAPISLAAAFLFAFLVQDGFTREEAGIAAVALVMALGWILANAREDDPDIAGEVGEFLGDDTAVAVGRELLRTLLGLAGTLVAAQVLVVSATTIAAGFGLGEGFVGMTLVAIGTSLPELATSVQAARKGETDLIVGNLLGSNVFNSLAVTAVAGLAGPGPLADPEIAGTAVLLMLGISIVATVFMVTRRLVVRWEGIVLLLVYVVAVPLLA